MRHTNFNDEVIIYLNKSVAKCLAPDIVRDRRGKVLTLDIGDHEIGVSVEKVKLSRKSYNAPAIDDLPQLFAP